MTRLSRALVVFWISGCLVFGSSAPAPGADSTTDSVESAPTGAPSAINDRYKTEEGLKKSIKLFEEESRHEYQKPDEIMKQLAVVPGQTICEIGAGSGYFTPYLSKAVGQSGKVYAEDIIQGFIDHLSKKVEEQQLANVSVVLGAYTETKLPEGVCDVAFVADVYHHFEQPEPMLASIRSNLKPDGRLVIIDWYRRENEHFKQWSIDIFEHMRLDKQGVIDEAKKYGWTHKETKDFLAYQYYLVFAP
jgi:ubiquinone/menaquinone biosynthesis C-methylase UbiE